jgi:hypothetical protein
MINGDAILAAVLSLREATEQSFNRVDLGLGAVETRLGAVETRLGAVETRLGAMETRLDRFEGKVLRRFDDLEGRLIAVESP